MTFDSEGPDPTGNLSPSTAELAQCEAEMGTLLRIIAELNKKMGSLKPPRLNQRGGVVWAKLQEVLASVEDSISSKRSWAAPITASDRAKQQQHLKAAEESWVKAAQVLKLSPSKENILDLETCDSQEELERLQSISQKEEEKLQVWRTLYDINAFLEDRIHHVCLSGWWFPQSLEVRLSIPVLPAWSSQPRLGLSSFPWFPSPPPENIQVGGTSVSRYIERLKSKNERLNTALERTRVESEQNSVRMRRLEADCSALQKALRYCLECEETYGDLLSLCDARKQRRYPPHTHSPVADGETPQPDRSSPSLGRRDTEELSTSFSTAGVTEETEIRSRMGHSTPELMEREAALRQKIELLKRDREAVSLPKASPGTEAETGLRACQQAGARAKMADPKKEKASLFHEFLSVREEMSDLRALVRIKEKELRRLEWTLMAHKAQEATGAVVPENLREELQDCRSEQQRTSLEEEAGFGPGFSGQLPRQEGQRRADRSTHTGSQVNSPSPARCHISTCLSETCCWCVRWIHPAGFSLSLSLSLSLSKALSSYRQIRRKYREQVWRLEQKVAAMAEGQQQPGSPKPAEEFSEWRREETVL
ncbi:unnamed protein product [Tetraodon nigroviridis]|uniref:(spotted green pufferfish) hypothetical protein n=1 Tax=Tetraodon nigroviridis TaxID=99883 RepID=Q4SF20_TETNG|nr:unnamed protein product [Tetraodon nigroviridis]